MTLDKFFRSLSVHRVVLRRKLPNTYVCGLYGFHFLVHIINYVVNVKYDGDNGSDANGNRNNIK